MVSDYRNYIRLKTINFFILLCVITREELRLFKLLCVLIYIENPIIYYAIIILHVSQCKLIFLIFSSAELRYKQTLRNITNIMNE